MEKKRSDYGNLGDETKGLQYMANKKALEDLAGVHEPVEPVQPKEPAAAPTEFEERVKRFLR